MDFEQNFFVFLTRIFRRGCQNRTLCASEIFFTKHTVLKKYISLKSLSVFRRQFSRFEAKHFWQVYQFCIQFVWRNLSRESFAGNKLFFIVFFSDFHAFLFSVKLRRFLLAVLSELNSTFPQDCLHVKPFLWKKILNCISLCRRKFFGFMAKRFLHAWSELLSLCPVDHSMKKSFLKNLVYLHEEVHWNFLEIRRKNFERVVRTVFYMPRENFYEKISYEKKQLFSGH